MPRNSQHLKETSFNFRIDAELKEAFTAATEAHDRPAAQVLREFMRAYVEREHRESYLREVRRQIQIINESPGEEEILKWIEEASDFSEWS